MISASLSQFQVRKLTLLELHALSQAGAWGDVDKPNHDMAFLLIAPDNTIEGERVFSLVAVWAHLHQAHHHSLGEATIGHMPSHGLMKAHCTHPFPVRDT